MLHLVGPHVLTLVEPDFSSAHIILTVVFLASTSIAATVSVGFIAELVSAVFATTIIAITFKTASWVEVGGGRDSRGCHDGRDGHGVRDARGGRDGHGDHDGHGCCYGRIHAVSHEWMTDVELIVSISHAEDC